MATNPRDDITVWDLPTRLFHWGLVVFAVILVVSGKSGRMEIHAAAGEGCLVLVTFRLIWGVFGSKTSRFADFLHGPHAILRYLTRRDSFHRPGHNPLGGWMVVVLLCAVMAQGLLGLFGNDDILFDGPLSHLVGKSTSDLLTSLHKTLFLILSGLVAIHVSAVLIHWLVLGDNLIRPMITGRKPGHGEDGVVFVNSRRAVLALLCSAALVWGLLKLL